jgi:hypothetical protein
METIGKQKLSSFLGSSGKAKETSCTLVRNSDAQPVGSYLEMARRVAELQFLHRDFVLMFRGQSSDWRNKAGSTTLKPTILRANDSKKVPTRNQLTSRYERLQNAERQLVSHYRSSSTPGIQRLGNDRQKAVEVAPQACDSSSARQQIGSDSMKAGGILPSRTCRIGSTNLIS